MTQPSQPRDERHRGHDSHDAWPATSACRADQGELMSWLTDIPDGARHSPARWLHLDATFSAARPNVGARLTRVVDVAQDDGVFGVADHEIRVWQVVDDHTSDGYLITIQPPSGPQLASGNLTAVQMLGVGTSGAVAAVHALREISRHVNVVLAEHARFLRPARTSSPDGADLKPVVSAPPRGFAAPAMPVPETTCEPNTPATQPAPAHRPPHR